jgi:hypothetical protein
MKQRISLQKVPKNDNSIYYLPENNIFDINVESLVEDDPRFIPTSVIENKLEAVIILLTSREIDASRFDFFIQNMLDTLEEHTHLNLIFFVNNENYKKSISYKKFSTYLSKLKPFFKRVDVINTNIQQIDDVYCLNSAGIIPKYGLVSGPNLLFLNSMKHCKRFNTVLLLETDCIFKKGWLEKCNNYVNHSGYFLISGSTYDGCVDILYTEGYPEQMLHINGVGFYNTGNKVFQQLMKDLDPYLIYYAKNVYPINAYDYVLSAMLFKKLQSKDNFKYWRYIYRNITKNSLIINCSLPMDIEGTSKEKIYSIFPSCVILHKKL